MSFSEVLHAIQSGNDGDLDTAWSLYMEILCVRARPLTFFMRQGKAPQDILENVSGSHDCFTGDTCVELLCKKQAKFIICNEKSFKIAMFGAGGKPGRWVRQEIEKKREFFVIFFPFYQSM